MSIKNNTVKYIGIVCEIHEYITVEFTTSTSDVIETWEQCKNCGQIKK